jgi:hypothetical protein
VSFGWPFELGGRRPYLPNPLTPFWPELRVQWTTLPGAVSAPDVIRQEMQTRLRALRPIAWLASGCALAIAGVAPLALLIGQERLFVGAALACLALSATACGVLASRRSELGLTRLQLVSMIVVALVCLPCAGNLARAVSAQRRWSVAAAQLPALGLDERRAAALRPRLLGALADAQRFLPEESPEYQAVSEQLRALERSGT